LGRTLIIGLDGVSWGVLHYLFENSAMPFLQSKISEECTRKAIMRSTIPPWTPLAWNSIASGVNPGKHGVFSFHRVRKLEDKFVTRLVTGYDMKYPRIHEMAAMLGLNAIAVNIPASYPPESSICHPGKCIVVNDWAAPNIRIYPQELERRYMHYFASSLEGLKLKGSSSSAIESIARRARLFSEGVLKLLTNYDWDVAFLIFSETDWVMHDNPAFVAGEKLMPTAKVFNIADEFIRKSSNLADNVVIVSDHGFSVCPYMINIPYFLKKEGIIDITFDEGIELKIMGIRVPPKLIKFVKRHKKLAALAHKALGAVRKDFMHDRYVPYSRAKAIMPDAGIIYCAPGHEEVVLNALKKIPEIKEVIRSNDVYWGPYLSEAPDYIIIPCRDYCVSVGKDKPRTNRNTAHHRDGIMIAWGKDVSKLAWKEILDPWDVGTYTIALAGMPLPKNADGFIPTKERKIHNYLIKWRVARKARKIKKTPQNTNHNK